MTRSYICTILLIIIAWFWSAESALKQITKSLGGLTETPQWSDKEQALYMVDAFENTFHRYDEKTGNVTSKKAARGPTGLILLLANAPPGYVMIAIQNCMYVWNFNSPNVDDYKKLLFCVDTDKPGIMIHDAKVDAKKRLWFGSVGNPLSKIIPLNQGSLYMVTNTTYTRPTVKKSPVGISDGITWSLDYKKMYYNDQSTRKIVVFNYNLETGEIANEKVFFDFNKNFISGAPNGMTTDTDGNIWVATTTGHEVLQINHVTAKLIRKFDVSVDQVTSLAFGGKDRKTLYITTSKVLVPFPRAGSGAVYTWTDGKTQGPPANYMELNEVKNN